MANRGRLRTVNTDGTSGNEGQRILLVDDDIQLVQLVGKYLRDNGYEVEAVHDGESALARAEAEPPMLVILDVMLPGADGLTVCRSLRAHYAGPILMLTALSDDIDQVAGLELGADDYLAKPVRPRVLLARVRALLRRGATTSAADDDTRQIQVGELAINRSTRCVTRGNDEIELTASEFELLWMLASTRGRVVSRDELHSGVLRVPFDGLDRTIDLRVSRLRRKLGDDPRCPELIKTVRGRGYMLVAS